MEMLLTLTKKQKQFIDAGESEVLFGGAAGGGKSHGQIADALLFALRYPGSRQLVLRRSYQELERSLIRASLALFPRKLYSFSSVGHTGKFKNGSVIDFGYLAAENDVYQYQSTEYDVIRFDELTHFTESQYVYMLSRVRGANSYPKQVKSTTNPGGVGHAWVKRRFVDPAPSGSRFSADEGLTRIFLPALLTDNSFLSRSDPDYEKRLRALPERERRALLYGDWSVFEGQYFPEFCERVHTLTPFSLPKSWRRYRSIDYGLDRLACLWVAVAPNGSCYVYRELCESDLPIGTAARKILAMTPPEEDIYATLAPPDLWSRGQESGKSKASLFADGGVWLTRTANDRESGWLAIKELLCTESGGPRLRIFSCCRELIRCLPALTVDKLRPTDCSTEPHEITHAPDALRGFAIFRARPAPIKSTASQPWTADMWEDYEGASTAEKNYLRKKYGEPR